MYSYLYGKVSEQYFNSISVEVGNVGYLVYVSNPYFYQLDSIYKIYLYQYIREDENTLYGFSSLFEKEMFLKLISVKGIGPKMALPMLATGDLNDLVGAIEKGDIVYLKKFPKIGEKVAKQIVLDLRGKLSVNGEEKVKNNVNNELKEVLVGLGYKEKEFKNIIANIDSTIPLESQVKEALKLLLK